MVNRINPKEAPQDMITFPKSRVILFKHNNKHLRYGQAFLKYMKLEKIHNTQDKEFCDRLWSERNEERAKAMIISRTDPNN